MESAGYRLILDDPKNETASAASEVLIERLLNKPENPHMLQV